MPAAPPEPAPRSTADLSQAIPVVLFLLIAAIGVGLALSQQASQRKEAARVLEQKQQLGLPATYPLDAVPLYPGARVKSAETGSGESTDGAPMHKWEIKAEVDEEDREKIFDYYKGYLMDRGMSQSMLIHIPSGYGVDYSDERRTVHIVIEKKRSDTLTQLEITLHELAD